ncbi:MAG: L-threonylcarbamoyladenylate synthase [Chloroflexaceae bacterium]|nr:L-threonylcarbamoyladenylate synthase [Chloroflexaceae bacterium]
MKVTQADLVAGALLGQIVSFPTDTVPALAVLPEQAALIFALKQRPARKPLILMGSKGEDLWPYVQGTPEEQHQWQQLAARYWPGQLTLVLPASARVPPAVHPDQPTTIGLRVPDSLFAQGILTQTGPLATTSANPSGEPPLESMTAIASAFPQVLCLDCPPVLGSGSPSTVVKWCGQGWEILRQGAVVLAEARPC